MLKWKKCVFLPRVAPSNDNSYSYEATTLSEKSIKKHNANKSAVWFNRMYSLHTLPLESVNLLVDIVWLVIVIYLSSTCLHINSIENVIILDNQHQFYSNINCSSHFKAKTYWIGALNRSTNAIEAHRPKTNKLALLNTSGTCQINYTFN